MQRFSLIEIKKRSLGLLWLILGIYVWLSSAVQLAHTDDLRAALVQTAIAAANTASDTTAQPAPNRAAPRLSLRSAAATAPAQPCAACEWIASVHVVGATEISVAGLPVSYDLVRAVQFETMLLQRSNRIVTLRGPPAA